MDQQSLETLRQAERDSNVIRLSFRDGTSVEARIRDVDWDRHHAVTYLDMDGACRAVTVDLDDIAAVRRLTM